MTTKAWSARALIGCLLLAGCYGSDSPAATGGQSHWLSLCDDDADCSDDQLCACGVCTVECDAECGEHGTCADVDDRAACDGASALVDAVCLEKCVRDADCMASGLACVDHVCVSGDDRSESQVVSAADAGVDVKTPSVGVKTPSVDASVDGAVTSLVPTCDAYRTIDSCPAGLVCHIDGTCLEPGVPDEDGLATLAVAYPSGTDGGAEYGLGAFVVTDDALFWQDLGTTDANDTHLVNGGINRVDLATGEVTTITHTLGSQLRGLAVDDDFAYVAEHTRFLYFRLDGSGAAGEVAFNTTGEPDPSWLVAGGSIYYAHFSGHEIRRMTPATGKDGPVLDVGNRGVLSLASDGQRVFAEVGERGSPGSRLIAIEFDGTGMETISDAFRNPDGDYQFVVKDGLVFSVEGLHMELRMLDMATSETVVLDAVDPPRIEVRSVADSFVYYTLNQSAEAVSIPYTLLRSRLDGEREVLRSGFGYIGDAVEKGGYVYWLEDVRVLRQKFE